MDLYSTLTAYQKNKSSLNKSQEYAFFLNYRHLLEKLPQFRFLASADNDFDVMRANIVIKSLINKSEIESAIEFASKKSLEMYGIINRDYIDNFLKERMADLPYLSLSNSKIFIPVFTRTLNSIYTDDYERLMKPPYDNLLKEYSASLIDPFETYNFALYDSFFTKLLKVKETNDVAAFYHFDSQTIYFINSQGRLDTKIALFDKYIKKIDSNYIVERITPAIDAYLKNDIEGLYNALAKGNLVSRKLIYKIKHNEAVFKRNVNKKIK